MCRDTFSRIQIHHSPDETLQRLVVNLWPLRKRLVRDVFLVAVFPKHAQDLVVDFFVAYVLHKPVQSFLVPEIRNLALQANKMWQGTKLLVFLEIIVGPEYNAPEHSVDALYTSARRPFV